MEQSILNPNRKIEVAAVRTSYNNTLQNKLLSIKDSMSKPFKDKNEEYICDIIDAIVDMNKNINEVQDKERILELVIDMMGNSTPSVPKESYDLYNANN